MQTFVLLNLYKEGGKVLNGLCGLLLYRRGPRAFGSGGEP